MLKQGWVDKFYVKAEANTATSYSNCHNVIHVHETSPDAVVGECAVNSYLELIPIRNQFVPDEWRDKRVRVIAEII